MGDAALKNRINIISGDSLKVLSELEDNSVDSVVTDPPYGLKFMSKKWDYEVPSVELWREVLRVLKPGGHLLSFAGTRTYHRMAVNIEDAGFEIRDQLQWLYGSGFPKSQNISKAIDKQAGAKREVVGINEDYLRRKPNGVKTPGAGTYNYSKTQHETDARITAPATPEAKQWDGFGTSLKPANEPIVMARKPLEKGLTVAKNVLKWGTGGLNIDGTRIEAADQDKLSKNWDRVQSTAQSKTATCLSPKEQIRLDSYSKQGRWPANIILDEVAAEMLDAQTGILKSGDLTGQPRTENKIYGSAANTLGTPRYHKGDSGGASRYFYCAKASKKERNAGLEGMPAKLNDFQRASSGLASTTINGVRQKGNCGQPNQNHHPTVKPLKLMSYLVRLVTPPSGTVLDPFMGSGSTGLAAIQEGFSFIGIELESEYFEIAKARLKYTESKLKEKFNINKT